MIFCSNDLNELPIPDLLIMGLFWVKNFDDKNSGFRRRDISQVFKYRYGAKKKLGIWTWYPKMSRNLLNRNSEFLVECVNSNTNSLPATKSNKGKICYIG